MNPCPYCGQKIEKNSAFCGLEVKVRFGKHAGEFGTILENDRLSQCFFVQLSDVIKIYRYHQVILINGKE